jgi:hypothetical protein
MKTGAFFLLLTAAAFAQYKMEPAGAPPADVAGAASLQSTGSKVLDAGGNVVCEVWVRSSIPSGPKSSEASVAFPGIPHGALLGVIRFPSTGSDRRGQSIKPGVYTLRYSLYPVDGSHQGVAPQRDFLLLVPAAIDKDPSSLPTYEQLVDMSRKASGTPHPAVLSIETPAEGAPVPGLAKEGEHDWVLNTKIGGTPIGIILIGKYEG